MSVAAQFEAKASDGLSSPFYFNPSHWRAMDGVVEGVKAREGIMVMTGPTGSGKTMLMRAISDNLGEGVTPLFLQYASLNFREFVNFLHNSLNVADEVLDASNKAVALRKFLYAQAERNETAVVFIDEAQSVEPDVLRMLPKLACFDQLENGTNVGLQFMLTGGSELRELLDDTDFDEVRGSIARQYDLRFFTREELKYFLEKRLAPLARLTPEPITDDAIETVGKYTGGSPRLMGMICSHAMLFAAENPGRSIDESMIEEAAEALMIEPVENPFSHEAVDDGAEASGPYSSAEIRGDVASTDTYGADPFGLESDAQEASMTAMDLPIAPSVDDSYDDDSFITEHDLSTSDHDSDAGSHSSVMDEMGMGLDVDRVADEWDEAELDDGVSTAGLAASAGALGVAGVAGGSLLGRVKSVFSRGKGIDVAGKLGGVTDTLGGVTDKVGGVAGKVGDVAGNVVDAGRESGSDLMQSGADALSGTVGTAGAAGGSMVGRAKSVFSRGKKPDAYVDADLDLDAGDEFHNVIDTDSEFNDDFLEDGSDALSSKIGSAGAAGGSLIGRAKSVFSRGKKSGQPEQILGAGRKGRNAERVAAPSEKRSMKTRVAGQRKKQLKYAGCAAAFCALAFGAYMVRTDVSRVFASASDSVRSTASNAIDKVGTVGSGAMDSLSASSSNPLQVETPNYDSSVDMASLNAGSMDVNAPSMPNTNLLPAPVAPEVSAPVKKSGWGARVEVNNPSLSIPGLTLPDAPKLPEAGVGLARGALDLVESALDKGQEMLPDDMKGAIDVAKNDVQGLRTAAAVNGATGEERIEKASKLVSEADELFSRQLYIAPRGGNAYDAYRAALDIDPESAGAMRGLENLRAFYSKKAEAARAQKQWDRANRHFETALAISQRKGVR